MTLGGRVSEEIFFGYDKITTGASDDLQKITRMAFSAVATYGMNDVIGPVSYEQNKDQQTFTKPFSEKTGELLDGEVRKMIKYASLAYMWLPSDPPISSAHQRTTELLTKHRDDVAKVAEFLLEKEVLTR